MSAPDLGVSNDNGVDVPQHTKQHWIPRSYLSAWTDPSVEPGHEPYVWRFEKEAQSGQRKAPKNLFTEADFYAIRLPNGERDLTLERGLGDLESAFCRIRDVLVNEWKPVEGDDRVLLCAFIAAMHGRTLPQRDHWREQWQEMFDKGEQIRKFMQGLSPAERTKRAAVMPQSDPNNSMSHEEVRRLVDNPMQQMLPSWIRVELPMLVQMSLTIMRTPDDLGFITSDSPCVWFDSEAHRRPFPFQQPFLASRTIEITFPISPSASAFLTWDGSSPDLEIDRRLLNALNRRTRFHAHRQFIVRRDAAEPSWF